LAVG
jgi:hypothetical protein